MDALGQLASGLASAPLPWLLAAALLVIGYLYRERASTQKELLDTVMRQEASHRETLIRIIPISEKLVESVEILERVTNALMERTK